MNDLGETPQEPLESTTGSELKKKITVGRVLAEAWRVYSRNFGRIAAIVAVIWGPLNLLSSYMDYFVFEPGDVWKSFRFAQMLDTFVGIIATAGVIFFGQAVLSGEGAGVGASLSQGLRAWGRLWLTRFFSGLYVLGGLLLLIVPGIYFLVQLSLAETVTVCERSSGRDALRRSLELTRGRFWEFFRMGLTLLGLAMAAGGVVALPAILFPALDHWLVDAAANLIFDIGAAFGIFCFLCIYRELTGQTVNRLQVAQVFE